MSFRELAGLCTNIWGLTNIIPELRYVCKCGTDGIEMCRAQIPDADTRWNLAIRLCVANFVKKKRKKEKKKN